MFLAPWRSPLARAIHRNRSQAHSRYLQLATIRADGRPANRTVVFRGFLENTNQLKFVTDARSDKADQINHSAWGEACWYFTQTREQLRLAGPLTLIGADAADLALTRARQALWKDLSETARLQFTWPHPGKTRSNPATFSSLPPAPPEPVPQFCLMLLNPQRVDHLQLRGNPQNRFIYTYNADEAWQVEAVNP
ncbi:MAG: pyridoxamine 5'-phosphate oxidase [Cyanothece sp. SIO1E1]|nr:pyridoxamine 5'-phosphate oxidase [Cyanothece sp. SIO1E1]